MKLLSRTSQQRETIRGRFSDGSDRTVVVLTDWTVTIRDDTGQVITATFDHDPTADELDALAPQGLQVVPTSKAGLERALEESYSDWLRWKTTRLEAVARSAPALVVTALTTRENAAWAGYLQMLQSWR